MLTYTSFTRVLSITEQVQVNVATRINNDLHRNLRVPLYKNSQLCLLPFWRTTYQYRKQTSKERLVFLDLYGERDVTINVLRGKKNLIFLEEKHNT